MRELPKRLRTTRLMNTQAIRFEAADRIEELEKALRFIANEHDNPDVNHVDFRVKAYEVAISALNQKVLL